MGEEFGGEWIHVCVWLSPFAAVPLKPSALLRGHIPQYEGVIFIWRRKQQHAPVFLPGESLGQRSLVGCSSWCCRVGLSDTHKKDFIRIYCIACPVGNCSSRLKILFRTMSDLIFPFCFLMFCKCSQMNMYFWCNRENKFVLGKK